MKPLYILVDLHDNTNSWLYSTNTLDDALGCAKEQAKAKLGTFAVFEMKARLYSTATIEVITELADV